MITLQERVHGIKPPQDWPLNKLHHVFIIRKGNKNTGMLCNNLLSLSYGRIVNKNIGTAEGLLPESFETYQIVKPGDIVMRLTDLQNDKRSLRQGLVKEKGIITSAYDAIYPIKGHYSRFWAYALLSMDLAKYYYSLGGGVRQSIKFKDFPNDWLHTPPLETQKEIADFLDRETARIDLLIEKKKRLVSVIENRMDSLVNETFSHFETRKLKNIATVQVSNVDKHIYENEIPVLACHYTDVYHNDTITDQTKLRKGSVTLHEKKRFTLHGGEVLITKDSETSDDIAIPSYVESCKENTVCGYHLAIIKPDLTQASGKYIYWALRTKKIRDYFMLSSQGVTRYGLPIGKIAECPIPFLSDLEKQYSLALKLFSYSDQISTTCRKIEKSIDKLMELRTSLITEAVTSQLDIKEWKKRGKTDKRLDHIEKAMTP